VRLTRGPGAVVIDEARLERQVFVLTVAELTECLVTVVLVLYTLGVTHRVGRTFFPGGHSKVLERLTPLQVVC